MIITDNYLLFFAFHRNQWQCHFESTGDFFFKFQSVGPNQLYRVLVSCIKMEGISVVYFCQAPWPSQPYPNTYNEFCSDLCKYSYKKNQLQIHSFELH